MRSGGVCTAQHALTPEAASVVKLSLSLARRRGHAQLTPLHVAATLLSQRRGGALIHSPNAAAALDLCFNVALNRLPTTAPPSLHHSHAPPPQLSNALVAALKRAQAHHRRSDQNQSTVVPRVEPEQLLLSILDDPSVTRVMREAGISSAAVKSSLQNQHQNSSFWSNSEPTPRQQISEIDLLLRLRTNTVIVVSDNHNNHYPIESLIAELASKLELRRTRLVRLRFSEVNGEADVAGLRRTVEADMEAGLGVCVFVGDLKWTVEIGDWVDRAVEEIRRLVMNGGDEKRNNSRACCCWLIGNANRETYFKSQMRKPSLQSVWDLQPISLPSSSGHQNPNSFHDSRIMLSQQNPSQILINEANKPLIPIRYNRDHTIHYEPYRQSHYYYYNNNNSNDKMGCCWECASNCEKEAEMMRTGNQKLPAWLQSHGTKNPQKDAELVELRRKWSRLCHRLHQQNDKTNNYYYPWPCPNNTNSNNSKTISSTFSSIEFSHSRRSSEKAEEEEEEQKNITALALGQITDRRATPDRESMTRILRENLPWQSEAIPSIIRAMTKRRRGGEGGASWLLVRGNDAAAKARLARAIAESLHGSLVVASSEAETALLSSSRHGGQGTLVVLVEDLRLVNSLAARSTDSGPTVFIVADNASSSSSKGVIRMRLDIGRPDVMGLGLDGLGLGLGLGRTKKRRRVEDNKSNSLDLNIEASAEDEDVEREETTISPNSSDLTRETSLELSGSSFAETIEDVFMFDRSPARNREAKEGFEAKMARCFDEVMMTPSSTTGNSKESRFRVDESVLEEVSFGCGCFTESVFEKWVQGVLRNALKTVRLGAKEKEIMGCGGGVSGGVVVRLSLGGGEKENGGLNLVDGFMGSCLPNKILISYNHSS